MATSLICFNSCEKNSALQSRITLSWSSITYIWGWKAWKMSSARVNSFWLPLSSHWTTCGISERENHPQSPGSASDCRPSRTSTNNASLPAKRQRLLNGEIQVQDSATMQWSAALDTNLCAVIFLWLNFASMNWLQVFAGSRLLIPGLRWKMWPAYHNTGLYMDNKFLDYTSLWMSHYYDSMIMRETCSKWTLHDTVPRGTCWSLPQQKKLFAGEMRAATWIWSQLVVTGACIVHP